MMQYVAFDCKHCVISDTSWQSTAAVGPDLVDEVHSCCDQRVHLALALKQLLGQRPVSVEPADMARQKVECLPPPLQKPEAIITAAAYSHFGLSI
jgi:hypothetical protein